MINTIELNNKKLFAILNSGNLVIDCWVAETLEEAQADNPTKKVIEVTIKNSPFTINQIYDKEIN
jgi:hypothetical protein